MIETTVEAPIKRVYFIEQERGKYETVQGWWLNTYLDSFNKVIAIISYKSLNSCVVRHLEVKDLYESEEEAVLQAYKMNRVR